MIKGNIKRKIKEEIKERSMTDQRSLSGHGASLPLLRRAGVFVERRPPRA
jgi:hypothetical protein